MKKLLVAVVLVMLVFTSAKPGVAFDPTEYYWFDADTGEYLHQNTIEDEMFFTQYNEGSYSPSTLRELGYAPVNVIIAPPADPEPIWFPDKYLYSHP